MLEGFYTVASGMLVQQRTLNVLTNNMANAKTPGFREERLVSNTFAQELMTRQEPGNTGPIGKGNPVRLVRTLQTDFNESSLEETANPFDVALLGDGFFNVMDADSNQFMTRNGEFRRNLDGYLELVGVGNVLGEKGEIYLPSARFTISEDGTVTDEKGKNIDKLMVTVPGQDQELQHFSNGLYTVEDPTLNLPAADTKIQQFCIERPNIDINQQYTLVMEAQRAFQACSSAMKIVDSMNQKAANQIASL